MDFQFLPLGEATSGGGFVRCIQDGPNQQIDSTVLGDDFTQFIAVANFLFAGPDGICDSARSGDDIELIPQNQGTPNSFVIRSAPTINLTDGICDDLIVPQGDDVLVVLAGQSKPLRLVLTPGIDGILDPNTAPGGDDILTGIICPNGDGTQTIRDPADDDLDQDNEVCGSACPLGSLSCIFPGTDGILQTVADPADILVPVVLSGANGISETALADPNGSDDEVLIPSGSGFIGTFCVDSGPDGIADTELCVNGVTDYGEECDDGNLIDGDGCTAECVLEFCGDGTTNDAPNEDCDDGNPDSCDGCSSTCAVETGFLCGDGTFNPACEAECDDGNNNDGDGCSASCVLEFCGDTIVNNGPPGGPGESCDDGGTVNGDGCSALCILEFCGDGVVNDAPNESCDDGNAIDGDDCTAACQPAVCGDGSVHNQGTPPFEPCDDGNAQNDDACLVGCVVAVCGDGFVQTGVEQCEPPSTPTCDGSCLAILPPGCGNGQLDPNEPCDDGNGSNRDDCLNNCELASCGDTFRHTTGTPPFEGCDDGNLAPGDGCSATCAVECGNGVIDGACSQGTTGASCAIDEECDTSLGAGDGVCMAEACDPGAADLCEPGPEICSSVCEILECGNGAQECDEECDLGAENGQPGSSCSSECTRDLVGRRDRADGRRECPSAWTLDNAPDGLLRTSQRCTDGAACDFDSIPGQCTFRVGNCLNRSGPPGCEVGPLAAFQLRIRLRTVSEAVAVENITNAIAALAPGQALIPGKCRKGRRNRLCTIPNHFECDRSFGSGDGLCDVGTGVLFLPPLEAADQTSACTPPIDVVVPKNGRLSLRSMATTTTRRRDVDALRLLCR